MRQVLIIGGGASGLAAAVELARRGVPSTVVEREASPGGLAVGLACKGAPSCQRCDACLPHDLRREASLSPLVRLLPSSQVATVERDAQGSRVTVSRKEGRETIEAGAVILATGAMPYDPSSEARLGHAECPDVLTSLEVERMLSSNEQLTVPSTGLVPKDMAIVQCVGSRDERHGAPYCSKACCKYGHKIGRRVRHLYADMSLTFFHMDWRPLEDPLDALGVWAAEDDKVRVVRSRPSEIVPGPRPVVRYTTIGESVAEDAFDLVMLTVGLAPLPDNVELAGAFGIRRDRFGFLVSDHEDTLVAGACRGPMDLRESIEDGIAAAGKAARTVERL